MSCNSPCASLERRRWLQGGLLALAWPSGARAQAAPPELSDRLQGARLQGSGSYRWWGVRVYDARLWVAQPLSPARFIEAPFALELQYARTLQGREIAERSVVEMRRIGPFDEAQAQRWQSQLTHAFPDVQAGDRLLGLHQPGQPTTFYCNGRPTHSVAEPTFAPLFFGIWLSDRSPDASLRRALYGNTP
jgi:hypothetical protein